MFNATGQCGFHSDLTASTALFRKENQSETVMTIATAATRYFRRLVAIRDGDSAAHSLSFVPQIQLALPPDEASADAPIALALESSTDNIAPTADDSVNEEEPSLDVHRRLAVNDTEAFTIDTASPPTKITLSVVRVAKSLNAPPTLDYTSLFEGAIAGVSDLLCQSHVSTFDSTDALLTVQTDALGMLPFTNDMEVVHKCSDPLVLARSSSSTNTLAVMLHVLVKAPGAPFVTYTVDLPLQWSVRSAPADATLQLIAVGATDVRVGASIAIQLRNASDANATRIAITVAGCSDMMLAAVRSADSTSAASVPLPVRNCTFVLSRASNALEWRALELQLDHVTDSSKHVQVYAAASTAVDEDDGSWAATATSIATVAYSFCAVSTRGASSLYVLENTTLEYDTRQFASLLTAPTRNLSVASVTQVSLVWSSATAQPLGDFVVNGTRVAPQRYNSTAMYVALDARDGASFAFTRSTSDASAPDVFDAIVTWRTTDGDTSASDESAAACVVRSNIQLVTVPLTGSPHVAVPYVYSTRVYASSFAVVTIPLVQVADPLDEYIEVRIRSSSSAGAFVIEMDDDSSDGVVLSMNATTATNATAMANETTAVIPRSDQRHQLEHLALRIQPNGTFTGVVRFHIDVVVMQASREDVASVQEATSARTVSHEAVVEWFDPATFTSIQPTPPGVAVYRSVPMRLRGNTTVSFSYRLSSCTSVYVMRAVPCPSSY